MENNKNKKSVKFQGDMLNVCDFIQVFVFTPNHHLKLLLIFFRFSYVFFIFVDMAFKATFMTKFTSPVGPRFWVSLREYTEGRFKVCFYQTLFKKSKEHGS